MKQLRLRNMQRAQLEQLVTALDAENGKLRQELATSATVLAATKARYRAVFSTLVAYLRRPPGRWPFATRGTEFDTLTVPVLLAEDSVLGWELKFEVDRGCNELRVTCVRSKQGEPVDGSPKVEAEP